STQPTAALDFLAELFQHPFDQPLDDGTFNDAALRVFAWQYERNEPYAAYCERRARTPANVQHWTEIPVVPTAAFKEAALVAGEPEGAEAVFRTSGTTRGAERRGVHYIPDISLYHASLIPNFYACLHPDEARLRMVSLNASAAEMPDS